MGSDCRDKTFDKVALRVFKLAGIIAFVFLILAIVFAWWRRINRSSKQSDPEEEENRF